MRLHRGCRLGRGSIPCTQIMMPQTMTLYLRRLRRSEWAGLAIGLALAVGCNRSGLDLAPVEGVVTYDGEPLAEAGVLFKPEQGPFAMGETDAEGKFTLMTANQEGALIGNHQVAISKAETLVKYVRGNPMPIYNTKPLIPQKYFNAETSELTATVEDDDNHIEFNLTAN
jgi:hypothetical protein